MKIHIDGVADLVSFRPGASDEGLLDSLSSVLLSGGRSLVAYELNGESIEPEVMEEKLNAGLGEEDLLNLKTEPLEEALGRQLDQMSEALANSQGDLIQIGEGLTKEDPSKALEQLSTWLMDLKGMTEVLAQLIHIFQIEDGEEGQLSEALNQLSSAFKSIEEGFQDEKVLELADYLEHDLPEVLGKVGKMFPELSGQIKKGLQSI